MKKRDTYCFVAGHSGGHVIPCITLAREHLAKRPQDHILFFTSTGTLDTQITQYLDETQFTVVQLPITSCTSANPFKFALSVGKLIYAFFASMWYLMHSHSKSVTSTGGICTIPVAFAAYIMRIPVDIYELNVLPGKTTYFLARMLRTLYCCFERTMDFVPHANCKKTGYPIRFFSEEQHSRADSCRMLGLDPEKKTLLILGGSQGSVYINTTIKKWISKNNINQLQIIHQTGAYDTTDWHSFYAHHQIPAVVFPFNDNMEQCYAAADVIICRSGAGTLFEVLYFHKPCITIPLELYANAHQVHNAFTIAQEYPELFQVVTQDVITQHPALLGRTIMQLLGSPADNAQIPRMVKPADQVTTV